MNHQIPTQPARGATDPSASTTPAGGDADVTNEPVSSAGRSRLRSGVRLMFVVSLVAFLLGGFLMVGVQAVQIVVGDGDGVLAVTEGFGPAVFAVSAVCGLLAFVLEYLDGGSNEAGSD